MSGRRHWFIALGSGALLACALGGLIWYQKGRITQSREEVATLRTGIESSRELLTGTNSLEREVIILRETEESAKQILPDEEAINALVVQLRQFEQDSQVRITGLKSNTVDAGAKARSKEPFDKVSYTLDLEADAFQLLDFCSRIEDHSRFMAIRSFKLGAATRRNVEELGVARHKVKMDVETYVYEPQKVPDPVKVEGYDRKRELLLGEINRRRQALSVDSYEYHGQRGRRDPWVDPRVPVDDGTENGLTIEQQLALVEDFVDRMREAQLRWGRVEEAVNIIVEMTERQELEEHLLALEEDLRRTEDQGAIRFVPSQRRLTRDVIEPLAVLREAFQKSEGNQGPSLEQIADLRETMISHVIRGEFTMALDAFQPLEPRLDQAEEDPKRRLAVLELRDLADRCRVALEFSEMELDIGGFAIMEGAEPVALIDGRTYGEGDLLGEQLLIRAIRPYEIEFIYRGVVLVRNF